MVDAQTEKQAVEPTAKETAEARDAQQWPKNIFGLDRHFRSGVGAREHGGQRSLRNAQFRYQTQLTKIQNDAAAAQSALDEFDSLLNEKWVSTFEMNDAVKTMASGEKVKKAIARFDAADMNWTRSHNALAAKIAMSVDAQFQTGVPSGLNATGLDPIWNMDCKRYALAGLQTGRGQPLPIGQLLEIVYHCHSNIKSDIDNQMTAFDTANSSWTSAPTEPDLGELRLSHTWWVDFVLQCLMVERVLAIRGRAPDVPYIFPSAPPDDPAYSADSIGSFGEDSCVTRYANDQCYGAHGPAPLPRCGAAHLASAAVSAPAAK